MLKKQNDVQNTPFLCKHLFYKCAILYRLKSRNLLFYFKKLEYQDLKDNNLEV